MITTNNGEDDNTYKFVELVYLKDNYTKRDPSNTESGYRLTFCPKWTTIYINLPRSVDFYNFRGIDILRVKLKTKNEVNGG